MTLLSLALSNVLIALILAAPATLASLWGRRPALTHALWLLVLIKLVTPPLFEYPLPWPRDPEPVPIDQAIPLEAAPAILAEADEKPPVRNEALPEVAIEVAAKDIPEAEQPVAPAPIALPAPPMVVAPAPVIEADWSVPVQEIVLIVWLLGSLAWLTVASVRLWRFQRLLRFVLPAPAHVQAMACELADALQVRCPDIGLLPGQVSPMLWGLGRKPRLLLPAALLDRLSADQLATLLAHELAHWRRRDDRVRWLELAVLAIYWWCPLAWWARRELQRAEEECCDAWVVAILPESARAYALALVETVDFLSDAPAPVPLAASGLGRVRFLKRRLSMILKGKTPRTLTLTGLLGVAGVGVLLLPLFFGRTNEVRIDAQQPGAEKGNRNNFEPGDREQFERARAEMQQMQKEIEKLQAEIQRRQQVIQQRAHDIERAMRQHQEKNPNVPRPGPMGPGGIPGAGGPGGGGAGGGGGPGGFPGGPGWAMPPGAGWGGPGGGNVDQRLKQVEAKLDAVLAELREMRRAKGGKPNPMANPMPMPNPNPKANNRNPQGQAPGNPLADPFRPGAGNIGQPPPPPPGQNPPRVNQPQPPQPPTPPPPPEDND